MEIRPGLQLTQKLTQTLKMTPEMQLAIKLLQMNTVELKDQILEVLETNPVMELSENQPSEVEVTLDNKVDGEGQIDAPPPSREFTEEPRQEHGLDWQRYLEDSENSEFKVSVGRAGGDDDEQSFENFVSKVSSLRDHLMVQLSEAPLNPTEMKIGEYLIGLLDRNGYLPYPRADIATMLKVEVDVIERVVSALQNMDPDGVGACDLRECLLIQARVQKYTGSIVYDIIDKHLQLVAENKLKEIVRLTGSELEDVLAAVDVIKSFNPKPGASFPGGGEGIYVRPDVFVEKVGDEYIVSLNQRDLPLLRINPLYRDTIKNKDHVDKPTYEFIKGKLEAARSFLRYLDKRKDTILNVTRSIVDVQREFLEHGIMHLKPMTLQDIAGMAGVHESTVSRAANGKYVQTPRGLFELKFFFSGGTRTQSGEDVSTQVVKKRIEEMVRQENPKEPLSDSDLVTRLKTEGITVARRTVAKYRTELNIQSSSRRKSHG